MVVLFIFLSSFGRIVPSGTWMKMPLQTRLVTNLFLQHISNQRVPKEIILQFIFMSNFSRVIHSGTWMKMSLYLRSMSIDASISIVVLSKLRMMREEHMHHRVWKKEFLKHCTPTSSNQLPWIPSRHWMQYLAGLCPGPSKDNVTQFCILSTDDYFKHLLKYHSIPRKRPWAFNLSTLI